MVGKQTRVQSLNEHTHFYLEALHVQTWDLHPDGDKKRHSGGTDRPVSFQLLKLL